MASEDFDPVVWDHEELGTRFEERLDPVLSRSLWSMLPLWLYVLIGVCIGVLLFSVGVWLGRAKGSVNTAAMDPNIASVKNPIGYHASIWIDVKGDVRHPGVYQLPTTARVFDAVHAAGGYLHGVDRNFVNEAAPLDDGMEVMVSSPSGAATPSAPGAASADNRRTHTAPVAIDKSASNQSVGGTKPLPVHVNQGPSSSFTMTTQVDLNDASLATLETIPGIGPKRAAAIVLYRSQHGRLKTVAELASIRGFGPVLYQRVSRYVRVSQ